MQISELFSSVITRDISSDRSIQIKISVNFLSFFPDEVMVVGDRIHDVVSAQQVGCTPVLFNKNKLDSFYDCKVISELLQLMNPNFFT
jgi:phosphoglycolate phosphatase-like HAD superfamily hydrolase